MKKKSISECERDQFNKLIKLRLPNAFKTVGLIIAVLAFLSMFGRKLLIEGDAELYKSISRQALLIGLLLMSISKDKIEDEMTYSLRMQSYGFAFILGVLYAMMMPYVDYGVSNALKPEGETLKNLGDFQILIFMLMIQLMFYHTSKRIG
ncbi:MAG: hypothetical protein KJO41_10535 [Bacteroidia bacterium]|nr:hypothetical protein [Bacteroidia bacterium]NND25092.1 hypothetical protein [Flavobacteriaceae bacterium]MBT8279430.1 hypothetical protein [Bacteroidia bacterium]NNK59354.1 hypothetical protein [Flavobacteriaceae bacterium]NNL33377.1 hypothetical protein [Flavobacteriaceae bacterium]